MNIKSIVTGKTVVIPSAENDACGSLVVEVLENFGAIVANGGAFEDFRHNHEQLKQGDFIVMAEVGTEVQKIIPSQYTPGGILWFFRGSKIMGEKPKDAVDIEDESANAVAKKVAQLIDESKFKLPEWFKGYSFRWKGGVVNHSVSAERCRKIELFKASDESGVIEIYAEVYLDEQGQLFNASSIFAPRGSKSTKFSVTPKIPSKEILTSESKVEVIERRRGARYGNSNARTEVMSFFNA